MPDLEQTQWQPLKPMPPIKPLEFVDYPSTAPCAESIENALRDLKYGSLHEDDWGPLQEQIRQHNRLAAHGLIDIALDTRLGDDVRADALELFACARCEHYDAVIEMLVTSFLMSRSEEIVFEGVAAIDDLPGHRRKRLVAVLKQAGDTWPACPKGVQSAIKACLRNEELLNA